MVSFSKISKRDMGRATEMKPKPILLVAVGIIFTILMLTSYSPKEMANRTGFAYLELRKKVDNWKTGEKVFSQPCWNVLAEL